jgi:hypothetical protein
MTAVTTVETTDRNAPASSGKHPELRSDEPAPGVVKAVNGNISH